ncbi:MAG: CoA transferase [Alphaproteobacteria bacterium]|nr:CoA transferase [Alphaproteobacteria bacterium]
MVEEVDGLAPGPLDGIRVLDFSMFLAGPYCSRLMADMGAEIIKVEPPGGDFLRHAPPFRDGQSAYFGHINCGKKSLELDLKDEVGRELIRRLITGVDVVLENFRPGVMRRLGLDYESLSGLKPDLIYCAVSGYGQDGPGAQRPAFAPIIHAASGYDLIMMKYQGDADRPPPTRSTVADILGATHALGAINAALVQRLRTGRGQYIDVAMMDAMHNMMAYEYQAAQMEAPDRPIVFSPIRTTDGFVMVAPVSPGNFSGLVQAAGRPELLDDDRFAEPSARVRNWSLLLAEVETWSLGQTTDACEAAILEQGCPCSRYLWLDQSMAEPQTAARGASVEIGGVGDPYKVGNCPAQFTGADVGARPWVPSLGQHNEEFFAEAGLSTG